MPNFVYDIESGAMYLAISDQEIVETIELTEYVYVDCDERGDIVGIECIGLGPEGISRS